MSEYVHDPDDPFAMPVRTVEVSEGSRFVSYPDLQPELDYWRRECRRARSENVELKRAIHSRRRALRVLFTR